MLRTSLNRSVQIALVMASLGATALRAQDTRTVTEPVIPPRCTVLKAQLASSDGHFSDADEQKLDTARIQGALDKCPKGRSVELASDGASNAFLSGPLDLRAGVTLLVDKGVTLYATRDPRLYETSPNACGLVTSEHSRGCRPFIYAKDAPDIGIMGDGAIDGRGWAKVLGKDSTWWQLAEAARGGGQQQVPLLIVTDHTDNFHLVPHASNGITLWAIKIDTPKSRNTDGFDPGGGSKNITMIYSYIRDGDDNIAIKGSTGGVTNMTVIHSHFYWGHGMSIGSENYGGVSNLLVRDLSIDGADNGIRIKSAPDRGGLVQNIQYDDVCIRNNKEPITLTTNYEGHTGGDRLPVYKNILLHNVRISGGGKILIDGYDTTHRIGLQLDGVVAFDGFAQYKPHVSHADLIYGPGPMNLMLAGTDATVAGKPGTGTLQSCDAKFVPFPTN